MPSYDYFLPATISVVTILGYFLSVYRDLPPTRLLLITISLAMAVHIMGIVQPYFGSEYEDAYVFQADSKDLDQHDPHADRFRVQISNFDLHSQQDELLSYNGHFTSFSSLISLTNFLFGYSAYSALYLNFAFTLLITFVLCEIFHSFTGRYYLSVLGTILFFSSASTNVFHTSGLSETYSSLTLIILFSVFAQVVRSGSYSGRFLQLIYLISLLSCLLAKRENMVMLLTLPVVLLHLDAKSRFVFLCLTISVLASFSILVSPFSTEFLEADFIKAPTFSINYFLVQFPIYIQSYLTPTLYGVIFPLFLLSHFALGVLRSRPKNISLYSSVLFLAFLSIYCLHYRSQFFIDSLEISAFDTFRYSNNFIFLAVVATVSNLDRILEKVRNKFLNYSISTAISLGFLIGVVNSIVLRFAFWEEEQALKIAPALEIEQYVASLGNASPIILVTDIPIVFLMFLDQGEKIRVSEFDPAKSYQLENIQSETIFYFTNASVFEKSIGRCSLIDIQQGPSSFYECSSI